jgi:ABC-2 type transport system ATP-binding protein
MGLGLGEAVVGDNLGSRLAPKLAVEARGLVKRFDGTLAVDGVDLTVPEGAIYGVLGPNGAGKTTTLRMLLGIIEPDEGERRVLGHANPQDVARLIGYLPEERGLYPSMKAYEAIAFMGALRGLPLAEGRKRGRELLESNGLPPDRQIRQLSKGMAQQVQLLGTLVHEPRLVVLDEPFSGLDAINQGRLERLIRSLAEKGADGDLLDPRDRPRRAAVRQRRDHRRGQGALRRLGRHRARPDPGASPARDAQPRRPVARGAAGRGAPRGQLLELPAARERVEPLLRALIAGEAGHPFAVDRARRGCTTRSWRSPARPRRRRSRPRIPHNERRTPAPPHRRMGRRPARLHDDPL